MVFWLLLFLGVFQQQASWANRPHCYDYSPSNPLLGWAYLEDYVRSIRAEGDYIYAVGEHLTIHEASSDGGLKEIGRFDQFDLRARSIKFNGDIASVLAYGGTWSIDLSNPGDIKILGFIPGEDNFFSVWKDDYFYTVDDYRSWKIYKVINNSRIQLITKLDFQTSVRYVVFNGDVAALMIKDEGFRFYDISTPSSPTLLSSLDFVQSTGHMAFYRDHLFFGAVGDTGWEIHALDLRDPTNPRYLGQKAGPSLNFAFSDDWLYATTEEGLYVYSFDDFPDLTLQHLVPHCAEMSQVAPIGDRVYTFDSPHLVAVVDPNIDPFQQGPYATFTAEGNPWHILVDGPFLYATYNARGVRGFRILRKHSNGELEVISDINTLWNSPSNFQLVEDYAVLCMRSITTIDISNPYNPTIAGEVYIPNHQFSQDLVVSGDIAYTACRGGAYEVGSITAVSIRDPENPEILSAIQFNGAIYEIELVDDFLVALKHGFSLVTTRIAWDGNGTHDEPNVPLFETVGGLEIDGISGYVDMLAVGTTAYILSSGRIHIVDCSVAEQPRLLNMVSLPSGSYSHELAYHKGLLYAGTPTAGVAIVDVTDPEEAEVLGFINSYASISGVAVGHNRLYAGIIPDQLQTYSLQCFDFEFPCEIDIRPHSEENIINCNPGGGGVIPVAILNTDAFNALLVDHTTVHFGPGEAQEAHSNHHGPIRHEVDVDADGDLDLLFHFRRTEAAIQCGDTEVTLTGETSNGLRFSGSCLVQTVGGHEEKDPGFVGIFPNPFNPTTTISFSTGANQRVRVSVYDMRGRFVVELTDQMYEAGEHSVDWQGREQDGRMAPSGEYFFELKVGAMLETRKAVLLK